MKKIALFIMNLILAGSMLKAQSLEEIRPSVNAQQFITGASVDVGLRTGQVNVNIPLFSLPGKGIDVPISLVFNPEHVTYESEASHIGLGWSLMAGGVITATIRDKDDMSAKKYTDIPWQYDYQYMQRAFEEELRNPYDIGNFPTAMASVNRDSQPDTYSYSFLGYSGEIDFSFSLSEPDKRQVQLYPHSSFKLEETSLGYKIIADNGIEYFFECSETQKVNSESYTTSWFLTEIKTPQGGQVTFQYANETVYDLTQRFGGVNAIYALVSSKRLERIESDYGHVEFKTGERNDTGGTSKSIAQIVLYDSNGELIKGYKLGSVYFTNDNNQSHINWHNQRMGLREIKEFNRFGESLPSHTFTYDYYFWCSKNSKRDNYTHEISLNTWADNPTSVAIVDRGNQGYPACYLTSFETPYGWTSYPVGYHLIDDLVSPTATDYFCLSGITYPSGGGEEYFYEKHSYSYFSNSSHEVDFPNSFINGRRLCKKEVRDDFGGVQLVEYKYCRHNDQYEPISGKYASSGVLIVPSIYTSATYKPIYDQFSRSRFEATAITTEKPQNSYSGSPVCYTEVEEVFKSIENGRVLGKKIYYFGKKVAYPPVNHIYSSYDYAAGALGKTKTLIPLQNKLYGTLDRYPENMSTQSETYLTYLAYPVNNFTFYDATQGKPLSVVTLDGEGQVVEKIRNEYGRISSPSRFGWKVTRNDDGMESGITKIRIPISMSQYFYETSVLNKSIKTRYFPASGDSIVEMQEFSHFKYGRILSTTTTYGNGEKIETKNVYPDMVIFDTQTGLSTEAAAIKYMVDLNMVDKPVRTTTMKNGIYVDGTYTVFKTKDNMAVTDSVLTLESRLEQTLPYPKVNVAGKIERHGYFSPHVSYPSYDQHFHPIGVQSRGNASQTFRWSRDGRHILAQIENCFDYQLATNETLNILLDALNDYGVITDENLSEFINCNKDIRDSLPAGTLITTCTYDSRTGLTSITDPQGITTRYEYDSFGRLARMYQVKNGIKELLESYNYNYGKS